MVWLGEETEYVFVVELAAVECSCYVDAALDLFRYLDFEQGDFAGGSGGTSSANTEVSVALICCTFAG